MSVTFENSRFRYERSGWLRKHHRVWDKYSRVMHFATADQLLQLYGISLAFVEIASHPKVDRRAGAANIHLAFCMTVCGSSHEVSETFMKSDPTTAALVFGTMPTAQI